MAAIIMYSARQYNAAAESAERQAPAKKEYLLVDGYNVIFAWPSLSIIAQDNLDLARRQLADILANYRGYTKCELVLVFDAYRVPGGEGSREDYHGIHDRRRSPRREGALHPPAHQRAQAPGGPHAVKSMGKIILTGLLKR